jgi:hypothetical protein
VASINGNLTGSAPFGIVVRKIGEESGNRCTANCNSFPLEFTADPGTHEYYFIVTDALGCVTDSRNIVGGVSNVNCDVVQPEFTYIYNPPVCISGNYSTASVALNNITNAVRYKVWYSEDFTGCETSTGFLNSSSAVINLITPNTPSTTKPFWIRVYKDATCNVYKVISGVMQTSGPCTPQCTMSFTLTNPIC